jgi:hypothetical protein
VEQKVHLTPQDIALVVLQPYLSAIRQEGEPVESPRSPGSARSESSIKPLADGQPRSRSSEMCSICLGDLDGQSGTLLRLPCTHVFHEPCIHNWIRQCGISSSCPLCKRPIAQTGESERRAAAEAERLPFADVVVGPPGAGPEPPTGDGAAAARPDADTTAVVPCAPMCEPAQPAAAAMHVETLCEESDPPDPRCRCPPPAKLPAGASGV